VILEREKSGFEYFHKEVMTICTLAGLTSDEWAIKTRLSLGSRLFCAANPFLSESKLLHLRIVIHDAAQKGRTPRRVIVCVTLNRSSCTVPLHFHGEGRVAQLAEQLTLNQ
jgi:hypothetical protein